MTPTQTAHRLHGDAAEISTAEVKRFITARLARREKPGQIADDMKSQLGIAIESEQVIPFWTGEIALPTQTGHRQDDDKSVQFPADEVNENLFTRMPNGETPGETPHLMSEAAAPAPFSITPDPVPVFDGARSEDAPATQTGHRQDNKESLQIPADAVDAPSVTREARAEMLDALGAHVKAKLGIAPDPAPATQTGRRQNQKNPALTDEM